MPLAAAGEVRALDGLLAGVYVSLHTSDPGTSGAGELSGNAYARQSLSFTNSGSNPTTAANSAVVQFPQAVANWGTITHFGIWSAASGGSFLGGGALDNSRVIETGDVVRWEIGNLKVTAN